MSSKLGYPLLPSEKVVTGVFLGGLGLASQKVFGSPGQRLFLPVSCILRTRPRSSTKKVNGGIATRTCGSKHLLQHKVFLVPFLNHICFDVLSKTKLVCIDSSWIVHSTLGVD